MYRSPTIPLQVFLRAGLFSASFFSSFRPALHDFLVDKARALGFSVTRVGIEEYPMKLHPLCIGVEDQERCPGIARPTYETQKQSSDEFDRLSFFRDLWVAVIWMQHSSLFLYAAALDPASPSSRSRRLDSTRFRQLRQKLAIASTVLRRTINRREARASKVVVSTPTILPTEIGRAHV